MFNTMSSLQVPNATFPFSVHVHVRNQIFSCVTFEARDVFTLPSPYISSMNFACEKVKFVNS